MAGKNEEGTTRSTTDRNEIERWAAERGGRPSINEHEGEAIPRPRFDVGEREERLKEIS